MTVKQYTARQSGPITFDARLTSGEVRITIEDRSHAEITISTADATGPSADAVDNATINDQGNRVAASVRNENPGVVVRGGGGTVQINSGGGIFIGGNSYGSIITAGRNVIVNGVHVSGSGAIAVGGSPILIEARLPVGSSVEGDTTSADLIVSGPARRVQFRSVSGDINLDGVAELDVATTSGDVDVAAFAGGGHVQTVSGDITVHAVSESTLRACAVSGDVRVTGARVALDASTVSGRVSQR